MKWITILGLGAALCFQSCMSVVSTYQSAKTAGEGNLDATGSFTNQSYKYGEGDEGDSFKYNTFGVQAAYGVVDEFDLCARIEKVGNEDEVNGPTLIALGGKYSLVENVLSAYMPLGFYIGEDVETSESFHIRPTLLGNIDVSDNFELTPMLGYVMPFNGDYNGLIQLGLSAGLRIPNAESLVIRPEFGFSFNGENSGSEKILHMGLGMCYKFEN